MSSGKVLQLLKDGAIAHLGPKEAELDEIPKRLGKNFF